MWVMPYRSGARCDWIKVKCPSWRERNRDRWLLFERLGSFGGLIARQFASSAWPLSGFGALRFITDDALRQPLAGLDHGLVSVLRPETLQQASEKRLR